uniref:Uncharacterized protein n=1 Tax=Salix viminalis TaxID=40686 RepID=A0A6N2LLS1_SALVM
MNHLAQIAGGSPAFPGNDARKYTTDKEASPPVIHVRAFWDHELLNIMFLFGVVVMNWCREGVRHPWIAVVAPCALKACRSRTYGWKPGLSHLMNLYLPHLTD